MKDPANLWILTGKEENWETAMNSGNIWGVRQGNLVRCWEKLQKGDLLLFYVKSPVTGIIGVGFLESKFKQDKPLWPDEIREKRVIYPYRFDFRILGVISPEEWQTEAISIKDLRVGIQAGVNSVRNPEVIQELLRRVNERWEVEHELEFEKKRGEKSTLSSHDEIRDKLVEIGRLQSFISEKEYSLDGERLDVAWRRVVRGVPTKVFEVQIGGNIHQALGKLKHAFDLWNSEPYLIVDEKSKTKAVELLSGTFHELKPHVKVVSLQKIKEFYQVLIAEIELKKVIFE